MALDLSRHLEPMEENLKMFLDENDYVALKFHLHESGALGHQLKALQMEIVSQDLSAC